MRFLINCAANLALQRLSQNAKQPSTMTKKPSFPPLAKTTVSGIHSPPDSADLAAGGPVPAMDRLIIKNLLDTLTAIVSLHQAKIGTIASVFQFAAARHIGVEHHRIMPARG